MQRITLGDARRHPWILRGIDDVQGWITSTDPSVFALRQTVMVSQEQGERMPWSERLRGHVKQLSQGMRHMFSFRNSQAN